MRKLVSVVLLTIAVFTFALGRPALAEGDVANGAKIFSANCTVCHAGGRNLIMAPKTLKKDALEKYGMYSLEAITTQVTKGKGAMPAFAGRLKAQQIDDVASYVLSQAEKW
ncbi:cytochrome c6 PetJ [Argonema galeatum]|uniref:cytochrome c6 PetJ n=1 Tax=Argonema galeatum TaxID=2942762 RepID=UPI002011E6ED|nr:c-type cytochrome [Argonema galeatum]MCL1464110.1 c-type cytochrome [Argonema galeatum A003/A1]